MSDDKDIVMAIGGFFFGIWSFFDGFKRLRKKRLIQNIPTSTIRGMAIGLVELTGKVDSDIVFRSPLTDNECVLYKYLIEVYRSSGRSGEWVKLAAGDSFYSPFSLNDGTGKVMVFPQGAELIIPLDYQFKTGYGKTMPENLIHFMKQHGISYKDWLGQRRLRFQEWFIRPQETVYILGSAIKKDIPQVLPKDELMRRIDELKSNPGQMLEIDLNKDGKVSLEEWDLAVNRLEQGLLNKVWENNQVDNSVDVIIGKGEVEKVFMISDHSEKELVGSLSRRCFWGIYGGPALSLAALVYLLFRLNILRF